MSNKKRHAWSLFCDDIRIEVGNKVSLMGIYNGEMFFEAFPSTAQKVCVVSYCQTSVDHLFKELKCEIYLDDALIFEYDVIGDAPPPDPKKIQERGTAEEPIQIITYAASSQFVGLTFDKPSVIKSIFIADGETILAGKLRINAFNKSEATEK